MKAAAFGASLALAQKTGWRQKSPGKQAQLRTLLSDGRWHGQAELTKLLGHRFGDVFYRVHHSKDSLHYERAVHPEDDSIVRYRAADKKRCTECSGPPRRSSAERIRELEAQVAELRERLDTAGIYR